MGEERPVTEATDGRVKGGEPSVRGGEPSESPARDSLAMGRGLHKSPARDNLAIGEEVPLTEAGDRLVTGGEPRQNHARTREACDAIYKVRY